MKQKSVFLTIALLFGLRIAATAQTPPAYVPTDGLVGWWPFNGNANDESGNGNNGTVNGATLTEDRFGNEDNAYNYDGVSNFIEIANSNLMATLSNVEVLSVSFWSRDENLNYPPTNCVIGNWSLPSGGFYINDYLGQDLAFAIIPNGQVFNAACASLDTIMHHFTVVYDGANSTDSEKLKFYRDGIPLTLNFPYSVPSNLGPGSNALLFGARWGNLNEPQTDFWQGKIDDIGIWNRALTQEEITDLYNANLCFEYITVTDTLIINLGPMGFNPVTYQNTILMYPNPTNDQLTIDYGDFASLAGYTLKIFNSIGQEIHSANINQQQEVLQLGSWGGAGTYQVVIYNAQGVPVDTRTIVLQ